VLPAALSEHVARQVLGVEPLHDNHLYQAPQNSPCWYQLLGLVVPVIHEPVNLDTPARAALWMLSGWSWTGAR
jgi:hypothetical protein